MIGECGSGSSPLPHSGRKQQHNHNFLHGRLPVSCQMTRAQIHHARISLGAVPDLRSRHFAFRSRWEDAEGFAELGDEALVCGVLVNAEGARVLGRRDSRRNGRWSHAMMAPGDGPKNEGRERRPELNGEWSGAEGCRTVTQVVGGQSVVMVIPSPASGELVLCFVFLRTRNSIFSTNSKISASVFVLG